jgi:Fic family protein
MLNLIVEITERATRLEVEKERTLRLRKTENRIQSIHSSLAIEQNTLSLAQVTDVIEGKRVLGPPKEIREVQNAYEAYQRAFKLNPYSIDDFLTTHRLMTQDLVRSPGSFRSGDVGIYDGKGNLVHVGARPQFVPELVQNLFNWTKTCDTPELVKSCVVHFELEIIHPFIDGNGRMGRLWQSLILSKWQQIFEWISIETIIYQHQARYYEMLAAGNKANNSTAFVEFMLEVILAALS